MGRIFVITSSLVYVFLQSPAFAAPAACLAHNPKAQNVPLCPANGSTLLPDSYPVMAVSLSDQKGGHEFVGDFVMKALKAQGEQPPQFFLNVSEETLSRLKISVLAQTKQDPKKRARWLASLTRVKSTSFNWQQDFQQTYVDAEGRPTPRELSHYRAAAKQNDKIDSYFPDLSQALQKECGIKPGELMPSTAGAGTNGLSGGNIEGGPAGLCVLGTDALAKDEHANLAKLACGGGTLLEAPTSFLFVGHTDEITATVRTGPGECDFAMLIASPRAALEVMVANPSAPAFELASSRDGYELAKKNELFEICESFLEGVGKPVLPNDSPNAVPEKSGRWIHDLLFGQTAFAADGADVVKKESSSSKVERCAKMTNADFLKAYRAHPELPKINSMIDQKMAKFREEAERAWQANAPNCPRRIIEMPMLYRGGLNRKGTEVRGAGSLLPNVTNVQQFNKTLLVPDPQSAALRKDIAKRMNSIGLKTEFVNTNIMHSQMGNLHCSTNTLRYCRPRAGAPK